MQVTLKEARDRLVELVELATRGEEVVISRDGAPVARLVRQEISDVPRAELVRRARALRESICPLPKNEIRSMIEEGRRL